MFMSLGVPVPKRLLQKGSGSLLPGSGCLSQIKTEKRGMGTTRGQEQLAREEIKSEPCSLSLQQWNPGQVLHLLMLSCPGQGQANPQRCCRKGPIPFPLALTLQVSSETQPIVRFQDCLLPGALGWLEFPSSGGKKGR